MAGMVEDRQPGCSAGATIIGYEGRGSERMNFADCACFVPEPGQNIHLPLSKKKQAAGDTVHSDGRLTYGFRCSPGPERNYNAKPLSRSIEEQWTRKKFVWS